ncbi:hypothetical protein SISSUDRAFT_1120703 [Sistotremastrum suecicum HHB10207 ss-3]|uniref:BTB domain-containing protein n=1 Tax=Sistotremastrum suecicum HHB10207 ss-3 TaxID=1314776 RepID=A0A166BWN7_9AGAM|nr:hypothetical protein SISSUDRAFT_1120703 [Sistotremastrum suecicum HHB10207 ss-3]
MIATQSQPQAGPSYYEFPPATPPRNFNTAPSHHRQRPSLSSPLSWLGRASSTSSSLHMATSQPLRISEPVIIDAVDQPGTRAGTLGSGATIVSTPQEALARHMLKMSYVAEENEQESPLSDPTMPPTPPPKASASVAAQQSTPTRSPGSSHRRRSLKMSNPPSPTADALPPLPIMPPMHLMPTPAFEPMLLSVPDQISEASQVLVALQTSTETCYTTMSTLTSRPSNLSRYLEALTPPEAADSPSPVTTQFSTLFRDLAGAVQTAHNVHIFLDRPSAPYTHIMAYLRTPVAEGVIPSLPRSVQLGFSSSQSRLEALLELRDEAKYLDLQELYRLCTEELQHRRPSPRHSRGTSIASSGEDRGRDSTAIRLHHQQHHRGGSAESLGTTVFNSPPMLILDKAGAAYVPPAEALRSRSHSETRSNTVRQRPRADWI